GKQLNQRSKFCPHCGKATPDRQTAALAVEDAPPRIIAAGQMIESLTEPSAGSGARSTRVTGRPANGSGARAGAARPYAPATYSLIGAFEQAGFGLRYGAWMFDFLITLIAIMVFTFIVTAVSHSSVVGSNKDLIIVSGLTVLLFILNFVVLAGANGQSAGMRILG